MRVQLDSSDWAEVMDVSELRSGDRRAVNRAVRVEVDENQKPVITGSITDDMRAALLRRVVRDWSLPFPIPEKDPKSLDKLTLAQEDELNKAVQPHLDLINGRVNPDERDTDPTDSSPS